MKVQQQRSSIQTSFNISSWISVPPFHKSLEKSSKFCNTRTHHTIVNHPLSDSENQHPFCHTTTFRQKLIFFCRRREFCAGRRLQDGFAKWQSRVCWRMDSCANSRRRCLWRVSKIQGSFSSLLLLLIFFTAATPLRKKKSSNNFFHKLFLLVSSERNFCLSKKFIFLPPEWKKFL